MNPPQRGRLQNASNWARRDRRNVSDPPRRVHAHAIPCPRAGTRWLRRFGERGWLGRPQDGNSAAGLGPNPVAAGILTASDVIREFRMLILRRDADLEIRTK